MIGQVQLPTLETSRRAGQALAQLRSLASAEVSRVQFEASADAHEGEGDSIVVELPGQALDLLVQLLGQLAEGNAVTIVPVHAELSTQQAADLLNVSRPFVIKLIERGLLPHTMVGTHRRVRAADVLSYQRERSARTKSAVDELAELGQELGT